MLANQDGVRGILGRIFEVGNSYQPDRICREQFAQSADILRSAVVNAVNTILIIEEIVRGFSDQCVAQPAHLVHMRPAALFALFGAALCDLKRDPHACGDQNKRNSGQDGELRVGLHFIAA